jgi:hypothetical protein
LEAEEGEALFEMPREHMGCKPPDKGIEGEQVRNRIDVRAHDAD